MLLQIMLLYSQAHQVREDHGGIGDLLGPQENKVRKVKPEKEVHQGCRDLKETRVCMEFQGSLAPKVHLDQGEILGQRAPEDQGEGLGLQGTGVTLGCQGFLAEMVNQVLRGPKDLRDSEGYQDPQDHRVHLDLLAPLGHLGHLDQMDL